MKESEIVAAFDDVLRDVREDDSPRAREYRLAVARRLGVPVEPDEPALPSRLEEIERVFTPSTKAATGTTRLRLRDPATGRHVVSVEYADNLGYRTAEALVAAYNARLVWHHGIPPSDVRPVLCQDRSGEYWVCSERQMAFYPPENCARWARLIRHG